MKRLTKLEEIKELQSKKVISLFSNFDQLLNRHTDKEAHENISMNPFYLTLVGDYLGEDKKIFDMGNGYYMITNKEEYHKAVNRKLVSKGIEKPFQEFEETVSIYRVVEQTKQQKVNSKERTELRDKKYKHVYYYRGEEVSESEALKLAADTTVVEQKGSLVKLKYFDDIYLFDQYDDFNGKEYSLEYVIEGDNVVREDYPRSAHHIEKVEYEVDDENCEYPIGSEIIGYYIT